MEAHCHIELLGGLRVVQEDRVITRFRTQKNGALLAYLAFYLHLSHPRETLIERFWPTAKEGRDSLNQAVSTLRRLLEPSDVPTGAFLQADRQTVHLNAGMLTTDVSEFEASHQKALRAPAEEQMSPLTAAVERYRGELLPGFEEAWILPERERLAGVYLECLHLLARRWVEKRDFDRALDYARRALAVDPLSEKAHRDLMRLYVASGRPHAAQEQYQVLEGLLLETFGAAPSRTTRELAEQIVTAHGFPATAARRPSTHVTPSLPPPPVPVPLPDLDSPAPSSDSSTLLPGRLPIQFTYFFGRQEELSRLMALLEEGEEGERQKAKGESPDTIENQKSKVVNSLTLITSSPHHLITLTGAGGCGKTRLALEVAERLSPLLEGAVWFVSLAEVVEAHRIPETIAEAMRLKFRQEEALEQVGEALGRQSSLLVLDGFEHLVERGAAVVRTLLQRVPTLTCLVTSRRALALPGEREFPVLPLPIPEETERLEMLRDVPSVQLFLDRAQSRRPDFVLTPRNALVIAKLCRCLEGIPLALELAAARAQVLSPTQMLERLTERFELLASSRLEKSVRHRSLWATMDWSYHLLSPELQRFFTQLSAFCGGWTLDAAAHICFGEADEDNEGRALDYLTQLRNHSLITLEEDVSGEMRFSLLDTLREYAEERLEAKERKSLFAMHGRYFTRMAEQAEERLLSPEQADWLDRLEIEHDNLRAAVGRYIDNGDLEAGLRLAGALWRFWEAHGHLQEGQATLEWLLALATEAGISPDIWSKAREGAEALALDQRPGV